MKKLTQIVMATLLTTSTSTIAETLTLHGRGQVLSTPANAELNISGDTIRKNVRVTLYNPNSFNVNVRLSSAQQGHGEFAGDLELLVTEAPETITIFANHGYMYEPESIPPHPAQPEEQKMCDLDMYQTIQATSTNSTCVTIPTVVRISWQDSLIRNSDGSVKTVAPITGALDYYYSDIVSEGGGSGEF